MERTANKDGSYVLTANSGMDLVIKDESGDIIARTKEVTVPTAGTLYVWVEVIEELREVVVNDAEKEAKIAELKAELARLETN